MFHWLPTNYSAALFIYHMLKFFAQPTTRVDASVKSGGGLTPQVRQLKFLRVCGVIAMSAQ